MPSAVGKSAFALLFLAAITCGSTGHATAQGISDLDTTTLPRMNGAREIYANPHHTIFVSPDPLPTTAAYVRIALSSQGWQEYGRPFSAKAESPMHQTMELKRGRQALSVFVSVAPAQGNAITVSYTAIVLANDLPFPKNATEIEFDTSRPHLNAVTAAPLDETLNFFRQELAGLGWALWSAQGGAPQGPGGDAGVKHDKGGYAYYVQQGKRPLLLTVVRRDDGKSKIELKGVPQSLLDDETKRHRMAETRDVRTERTAKSGISEQVAPPKREPDPLTEEIMKLARETMRDALKPQAPVRPQVQPQPSSEPALRALHASDTVIPVPETAEGLDVRGDTGEIKFKSPSSVPAIAAFFRSELKSMGWREQPTVINNPNMAVLDFTNPRRKRVSITIMQMGPMADVRAHGNGLVTETAPRGTPAPRVRHADATPTPGPRTGAPAAAPAIQQLESGEERSGLPVPSNTTQVGTEKTPFRVVLTAKLAADLPSVLAFYRRELGKRNWKEESQGAVTTADKVVLAYTSPEGPAILKLDRAGDDTDISLSLRKPAEASKAGMLPKPGQVKVLLGNMTESEAVVTINRQTIKVSAGAGSKGPNGPTIDLPPGKYKISFKVARGPVQTEDVEVGANETWGVIIGPGGALPLQMY
jgi:hypothetical protein